MSEVDTVQPSQVLTVNPGDVVVFQMPAEMSPEASRAIHKCAKVSVEGFLKHHPETTALLLPDGWSVATIRHDMIAALRAWREAWGAQGDTQIAKMSQAALLTEQALKHLEPSNG